MLDKVFQKLGFEISKNVKPDYKKKEESTKELLLMGRLLANQNKSLDSRDINDFEFSVFSQFGDDGIIQFLVNKLNIENDFFVEFGVEDYNESNTRFLLMNNNWSGFVMDGSTNNMNKLRSKDWFWKYDLNCKDIFITKENINELLKSNCPQNIGLLHIDIDGNDYHVFEAIDLDYLKPSILIFEYNSVFNIDEPVTVPYDPQFIRSSKHYSNLYFGASLSAFHKLSKTKGYTFVGCNSSGNNAYFVKNDLMNDSLLEKTLEEGYVKSKFREARNEDGKLFLESLDNVKYLIKDLPLINV